MFTFEARTAWDEEKDRLARGSVAQVFAYDDPDHTAPLPILDDTGVLIDSGTLDSGPVGVYPGFKQPEQGIVRLWDGTYEVVVRAVEYGGSDAQTADNIQDPDSETRTALNATFATNDYVGTLAYGTNLEATDATVANWIPNETTETGKALSLAVTTWVNDPASKAGEAMRDTFAQGLTVSPKAPGAETLTAIQTALNSAATFGVPAHLRGNFSVDGLIDLPSGSRVNLDAATITQTAAMTTLFRTNSTKNIRVVGGHAVADPSGYVNSSTVYNAVALAVMGTSSDVSIRDFTTEGFAGASVMVDADTDDIYIDGLRSTGPGPTYITAVTDQYSASVRMLSKGHWALRNSHLTGYAQGLVTSTGVRDFHVTGNFIHDIAGQHGLYIGSGSRGVVSKNIVSGAPLLGMKIQLDGTGDASNVVISDNVFHNVGDSGILLTNTSPTGGGKLRGISVIGNIVNAAGAAGLTANNVIGANISDNMVTDAELGYDLTDCEQVRGHNNSSTSTRGPGLRITTSHDVWFSYDRIIDPASANGTSTEHGLHVVGACTDIVLDYIRVTDAFGNMRYGIYVNDATTIPSLVVRGCFSRGATDYGARFAAESTIREYRDNYFEGGAGSVLLPPSEGRGAPAQSFGSAPPTTGRHEVGAIAWNTTPAAGGSVGWVCTTAGTPGTWNAFGAIS